VVYSHELDVLFFMEGMSVPLHRAQLDFKENAPATGTFDLVPTREINRVRPRTLCQLFVRDFTVPGDPFVLAYEGEVAGYGAVKNPEGVRAFRVSTVDFLSYWDNAKLNFLNSYFGAAGSTMQAKFYSNQVKRGRDVKTLLSTDTFLISEMNKYLNNPANKAVIDDIFFGAIKHSIASLGNVNAFYAGNMHRLKIIDRIAARSSGNLDAVLKYQLAMKMITKFVGEMGGNNTVLNCIQRLLGLIFHSHVTAPFPSFINDKPAQFLIKPDAYMIPPPKCNVVFPNQYQTLDFQRNFFKEPTRLIMQPTVPIASGYIPVKSQFVAPEFFDKYYTKEDNPDPFPVDNSLAIHSGVYYSSKSSTSRDAELISYAEAMKGHNTAFIGNIPGVVYLIANDQRGEFNKNQAFRSIAKYFFDTMRYGSRTFSVNGKFNMAPVPGFPALFVDSGDSEQNILANLTGVTHIFSATQGTSTMYHLDKARFVDETEDYDSGRVSEVPIPPWFRGDTFGSVGNLDTIRSQLEQASKTRADELNGGAINIYEKPEKLNKFYEDLLGTGSIITPKQYTILGAAWQIAKDYKGKYDSGEPKKTDRREFVENFTHRPYTTLKEAMSFLGAKNEKPLRRGTKDVVYTGGGFTSYAGMNGAQFSTQLEAAVRLRREVIKKYRAKLFSNRGFNE